MNSRLLVRLQKKHGSQRCRVELVELTVDDAWQIAASQVLATGNFRDRHAIIGEVTRRNVLSRSRQFGTSAEVSGQFGTSAEVSFGHFGTSLIVPKCLGSEVSWVRSVLTPN